MRRLLFLLFLPIVSDSSLFLAGIHLHPHTLTCMPESEPECSRGLASAEFSVTVRNKFPKLTEKYSEACGKSFRSASENLRSLQNLSITSSVPSDMFWGQCLSCG